MTREERHLQWLLYFAGTILLLATLTIFLPVEWMRSTHAYLGLGEFPERPLTLYLARSISALYAFHGLLYLGIASDVRRYVPVVRLIAFGYVLFGTVMLGIDLVEGMPWYWTAIEGPSLIGMGFFTYWLYRRAQRSVTTGPSVQ